MHRRCSSISFPITCCVHNQSLRIFTNHLLLLPMFIMFIYQLSFSSSHVIQIVQQQDLAFVPFHLHFTFYLLVKKIAKNFNLNGTYSVPFYLFLYISPISLFFFSHVVCVPHCEKQSCYRNYYQIIGDFHRNWMNSCVKQ